MAVGSAAPNARVLVLDADGWLPVVTHERDAIVRAPPFDAVMLELGALWR